MEDYPYKCPDHSLIGSRQVVFFRGDTAQERATVFYHDLEEQRRRDASTEPASHSITWSLSSPYLSINSWHMTSSNRIKGEKDGT